MLKFWDFPYTRPDVAAICEKLDLLTAKFEKTGCDKEQIDLIAQYRDILIDFNSMRSIASIRHTINTTDAFYVEEDKFFNQNNPKVDKSVAGFGVAILKSTNIPQIKAAYGDIFITNMEFKSKAMKPEIITLMQEENALVSEYQSFNARAKIPFRGEELTIPGINLYMNSDDRETRKAAYTALSDFYCKNSEFYDEIYDKMVKNRTKQANEMGFDSYTKLGYIRRNRNCFTAQDVDNFRKQMVEDIVPAVVNAKKAQASRLGFDTMKLYDNDIYFADGNPKTFEKWEDMMKATKEAFSQLSPITKEFIELMMDGEYYDAPTKPGKRVGAYCNYIPAHKAPFVFLNYNGSAAEVTTTFHEFGHGLNCYFMREDVNSVLRQTTLDTAEVHSMTMEFMAEPYLDKFFSQEDLKKQNRSHIEHCLAFLSYGTMVDHFQHIMYDQPNLTPAQRNEAWRKLEEQYRPYLDFDGIEYYETGRTWQRQQHIFSSPFYYIDYVLAQTIALQFWQLALENHEDAFNRYVELTRKGGSLTFVDLVRSANLKVPFEAGALKDIRKAVEKTLG